MKFGSWEKIALSMGIAEAAIAGDAVSAGCRDRYRWQVWQAR
jgi:hypothetical protein